MLHENVTVRLALLAMETSLGWSMRQTMSEAIFDVDRASEDRRVCARAIGAIETFRVGTSRNAVELPLGLCGVHGRGKSVSRCA